MTDHTTPEPTTPEPTTPTPQIGTAVTTLMAFPPFRRYIWEVLTYKLVRQHERTSFHRLMGYMALLFIASQATSMASSSSGFNWLQILTAASCTSVQWIFVGMVYDRALRRETMSHEHRDRILAKLKEETDALIQRASDRADRFRLGAIEAVTTHAMQIQRKMEEQSRDVDGEGWKHGNKPSEDAP